MKLTKVQLQELQNILENIRQSNKNLEEFSLALDKIDSNKEELKKEDYIKIRNCLVLVEKNLKTLNEFFDNLKA